MQINLNVKRILKLTMRAGVYIYKVNHTSWACLGKSWFIPSGLHLIRFFSLSFPLPSVRYSQSNQTVHVYCMKFDACVHL